MVILIDNGHGDNTRGKCSPDRSVLEWRYTREIARELCRRLGRHGYDARLVVPEDTDTPLRERVRRINGTVRRYGRDNVMAVSIHLNASGMGTQWGAARGWQACVGLNASQRSKDLATALIRAAKSQGLHVRTHSPSVPYWPQDLAICRDTLCPAVLTENLFMDNRDDAAYLLTAEGREAIIGLHVAGIVDYIKGLEK